MLVTLWGKSNTDPLLMRMLTGTITVEFSMEMEITQCPSTNSVLIGVYMENSTLQGT